MIVQCARILVLIFNLFQSIVIAFSVFLQKQFVAMCIDDVHWADKASVNLICDILIGNCLIDETTKLTVF
jgi:hypothetical protein